MLKFNNKNTRTMSPVFLLLTFNISHTHFSSVFIVDFEQVNVSWVFFFKSFHATGLFLYPVKHQKNRLFLMFTGGIERDQLPEMA